MILTALRMMEDCDFSTLRYVRDDDYTTAMTISSVLQQHMLRVISELPKKTTSRTPVGHTNDTILLQTFWDNLPDEFEAKDFIEKVRNLSLTPEELEKLKLNNSFSHSNIKHYSYDIKLTRCHFCMMVLRPSMT